MSSTKSVPSFSVTYACNGSSTRANEFGMRAMQERPYEKRGEQYLLIKSPLTLGKKSAWRRGGDGEIAVVNSVKKQSFATIWASLL